LAPSSSAAEARLWLRIPAVRPRVTLVLLALLVVVYLPALLAPRLYIQMVLWGSNEKFSIIQGDWYRLITSTFLHDPSVILHILFNGYALYAIGMELEAVLGRIRFIYVYLMSGIAGSVASFIVNEPGARGLGASGAIFGLIGALGVYYWLHRGLFGRMGTAMFWNIVIIIAINMGIGFASTLFVGSPIRIDNSAHFGGLVAGLALGFVLCPRYKLGGWYNPLVRNLENINRGRLTWLAAGLIGADIVGLFLVMWLLYRSFILVP
jgi:rhomboid protease GluP